MFQRLVSVALVLTVVAPLARSQSAAPVARVAAIFVQTDSKGKPESVHAEFELTSEVVVDSLFIFYRTDSSAKYNSIKLKKMPNLHYFAMLPNADSIEYYLTLRRDSGESLNLLGESSNPSQIGVSDLEFRKQRHPETKMKVAIGVATIVAALLAIFGAGTAH